MTDKFASGVLPYTAAEREADDEARRKRDRLALIRKLSAPRGDYSRKGTAQTKAWGLRMVGESA